MGIRKSFSRAIKPFTNVRGWSDYDRTKDQTENLLSLVRRLFIPKPGKYQETFEQALARYHLEEKDLTKRRRQFMLLAIVQLFLMAFLLYYGGNLLADRKYPGGIVAIAFGFVLLSLALRNHFWYFQIKKRKLGCSLTEYIKEGLLGVKK